VTQLFCFEGGSGGTPVVLLHGFGGSHADWGDVLATIGSKR